MEEDLVSLVLWEFLGDREIAYVLGPDVSFHVQVAYVHNMLKFWNAPRNSKFRVSPEFMRWVARNYKHFELGSPTEDHVWIKRYAEVTSPKP